MDHPQHPRFAHAVTHFEGGKKVEAIKQLLLGIAFLLFGIFCALAGGGIWEMIGLLAVLVGIIYACVGAFEKKDG